MSEHPELSDGHVRIANEIMEAMARTYMSSYESQYLWHLFRQTYGWNKKDDAMPTSQVAESTGMHVPHVSRTKRKLMDRRIITQTGNKISFNKYYSQWRLLPKQVTVTQTGNLPKQVNELPEQVTNELPKQVHTKDSKKDTITKDIVADAPKTYSEKFFQKDQEVLKAEAEYFVNQGVPVEAVRIQFAKFMHYWQERTQGGRKERWQTQKTFEVRRRLVTWFNNAAERTRSKAGSLSMPEGL